MEHIGVWYEKNRIALNVKNQNILLVAPVG